MLEYLFIENIAVIAGANIELDAGFTALTGETGSGKSIIIDSIMAVLGEKTSKELIRNGENTATVSACFSKLSKLTVKLLKENGYINDGEDLSENGEKLIIKRILNLNGNNKVFINNQPGTVSFLKTIGKTLVNIHGQHDSQQLLDPQNHYYLLDAFMNNKKVLEDYKKAFENYVKISKQLKLLDTDEEELNRRMDLLKFQIEEIENAEIYAGESDILKARITELKNSEAITNQLTKCYTELKGNDNIEYSAVEMVQNSVKALSQSVKTSEKILHIFEKLETLENELSSVADDIEEYKNSLEYSEKELNEKQERLDFINELILKYGGTEEKVSEYLNKANQELESIEFNIKDKSLLEEQLNKAEEKLIECGDNLTSERTKSAEKLSALIEKELALVDFKNAKFKVNIEKSKYTSKGCNNIEFLISANLGENLKPLAKVASGGELSRIMLAIRSILFLKDDVGTLIFDEIDSGISGSAANKVANKLLNLSEKFQVICVTHLAQIASKANNHLLIEKTAKNGKTYTDVKKITGEERIKEIARIISGNKITDNIYNSAKEMLGEE